MKKIKHYPNAEPPLLSVGGGSALSAEAKRGSAAFFPDVQLVRPRPAAELLGISLATFWRLVGKGVLNPVKLSPKLTAVRLSDIRTLIEERSKA